MTTPQELEAQGQWNPDTSYDVREYKAPRGHPGQGQRLWDVISESWTEPIPPYQAQQNLRKVVFRCSVCPASAFWSQDVERHLVNVRESTINHQDAQWAPKETEREGHTRMTCSGCGHTMKTRARFQEHLEKELNGAEAHEGAKVVMVHQFVATKPQEPAEPVSRENQIDKLEALIQTAMKQLAELKNGN